MVKDWSNWGRLGISLSPCSLRNLFVVSPCELVWAPSQHASSRQLDYLYGSWVLPKLVSIESMAEVMAFL